MTLPTLNLVEICWGRQQMNYADLSKHVWMLWDGDRSAVIGANFDSTSGISTGALCVALVHRNQKAQLIGICSIEPDPTRRNQLGMRIATSSLRAQDIVEILIFDGDSRFHPIKVFRLNQTLLEASGDRERICIYMKTAASDELGVSTAIFVTPDSFPVAEWDQLPSVWEMRAIVGPLEEVAAPTFQDIGPASMIVPGSRGTLHISPTAGYVSTNQGVFSLNHPSGIETEAAKARIRTVSIRISGDDENTLKDLRLIHARGLAQLQEKLKSTLGLSDADWQEINKIAFYAFIELAVSVVGSIEEGQFDPTQYEADIAAAKDNFADVVQNSVRQIILDPTHEGFDDYAVTIPKPEIGPIGVHENVGIPHVSVGDLLTIVDLRKRRIIVDGSPASDDGLATFEVGLEQITQTASSDPTVADMIRKMRHVAEDDDAENTSQDLDRNLEDWLARTGAPRDAGHLTPAFAEASRFYGDKTFASIEFWQEFVADPARAIAAWSLFRGHELARPTRHRNKAGSDLLSRCLSLFVPAHEFNWTTTEIDVQLRLLAEIWAVKNTDELVTSLQWLPDLAFDRSAHSLSDVGDALTRINSAESELGVRQKALGGCSATLRAILEKNTQKKLTAAEILSAATEAEQYQLEMAEIIRTIQATKKDDVSRNDPVGRADKGPAYEMLESMLTSGDATKADKAQTLLAQLDAANGGSDVQTVILELIVELYPDEKRPAHKELVQIISDAFEHNAPTAEKLIELERLTGSVVREMLLPEIVKKRDALKRQVDSLGLETPADKDLGRAILAGYAVYEMEREYQSCSEILASMQSSSDSYRALKKSLNSWPAGAELAVKLAQQSSAQRLDELRSR